MGCCGQGRKELRAGSAPARPRATGRVRYLGSGRVRARGAATGSVYEFARGESREIAAADVPTLVRTGLFARQ